MGGSAGTVSAITRPTHRICAHRRYPLPDLDRGQCLLASSNTIAAAGAVIAQSAPSPCCYACAPRERESTCHGASSPPRRQHRGFTGSSRREEAPKKPSAIGPARRQSPLAPKASGVSAGEPQPRARRRAPASSIAAAASTTAPHPHRRAREASSSARVAPHDGPTCAACIAASAAGSR